MGQRGEEHVMAPEANHDPTTETKRRHGAFAQKVRLNNQRMDGAESPGE